MLIFLYPSPFQVDFLEELPGVDTAEMEDLYRHFLLDEMPEVIKKRFNLWAMLTNPRTWFGGFGNCTSPPGVEGHNAPATTAF